MAARGKCAFVSLANALTLARHGNADLPPFKTGRKKGEGVYVTAELCVSDRAGAQVAERLGYDRLELCCRLECGGLTPPESLVADVCENLETCPIQLLVRPRPGDFVYDTDEVAAMVDSIRRLRRLAESYRGTVGFVVGALTADRHVDVDALARLVAAADAPVTFHRASDQVRDLARAWLLLGDMGVDRVLTTGGHPTRAQPQVLARLAALPGPRVLASGGLRADNVAEVVDASGVSEVHMRAPGLDGGTDPGQAGEILEALRRWREPYMPPKI